jgi:hypothetical protein
MFMTDSAQARIFISYSRKDGGEFADSVRKNLLKKNLSIWQDIVTLEGGRDWWSQIEDAVKSKSLEHVVLILTPQALASSVIRREIRLARQEGKTVCPIRGPGLGDLNALPRWIGHVYDLDLPEHFTTLIRVLEDRSRQRRVPVMAPALPFDFVQRPAEFDTLKRQLLDAKGDATAVTAAFRGAGGYGKTTLAKAVVHDPDIQDAYFDGILWVELGQWPENLLAIISDLITRLTGTPPGLQTINAVASALDEALGDRRVLMVIDDVWREQDLRPFLQGGSHTSRLITTRIDKILPTVAVRQPVQAMTDQEAFDLLSSGLPPREAASQHLELGKIAARLCKWVQLLKLVNGFLRDRVVKSRQPLADAIAGVNHRLDEKGLVAFDARKGADRTNAMAVTIGVSLELLDDNQRARFHELVIFPAEADIPLGVVTHLWADTGDLNELETEDLLTLLYEISLLLNLDFGERTLRLHDTVRQFLQGQADKDGGLVAQHKRVLTAIRNMARSEAYSDPQSRRLLQAISIGLRFRSLVLEQQMQFTSEKGYAVVRGAVIEILQQMDLNLREAVEADLNDPALLISIWGNDREKVQDLMNLWEDTRKRLYLAADEVLSADDNEGFRPKKENFFKALLAFREDIETMNREFTARVLTKLRDKT